ncbi:hypothetical protein OUZ56_018822 [Daphnia magna]|uniref:Uncharacterized protein n=1 Tax=Daphnia magna TaxID=35525 RepID=A0ABQ9Z9V1_9CRUS|nr:hypothetical protein OUZ56_018822 [Daphnia magna]
MVEMQGRPSWTTALAELLIRLNVYNSAEPRDSGLGERTVVDPDDSGEEAGARERSATYPPLPGSRAESRLNLVEAGIEGAYYRESLQWDSGDLREDAVELRATSEPEEGTSQEGSGRHGWRSRPKSSRESSLAESVDEEEPASESVDEEEPASESVDEEEPASESVDEEEPASESVDEEELASES